jgi:hypothetical protein
MSTAEVKDGAANGPKVEVVHSKPVGVPGQEEGGLEDSEPEDREGSLLQADALRV